MNCLHFELFDKKTLFLSEKKPQLRLIICMIDYWNQPGNLLVDTSLIYREDMFWNFLMLSA